jgi:hypothetical protein
MSTSRTDTSSTATRLLRLVLPDHDTSIGIVSHHQLMDESERRLSNAAHCGAPLEQAVANRILDSTREYGRWEDEHAGIMKRISTERRCEQQKIALLDASLALIHRKALFEYLRDRQVRGEARRRLLTLFHSHRDYEAAVIAEHGNYLRSAASFLCSSHVGTQLLMDEIFDEPLAQYENLYCEYFRAYCDLASLRERDPAAAYLRPLVMPMKRQVVEWRASLLALANSRSGIWRAPPLSGHQRDMWT